MDDFQKDDNFRRVRMQNGMEPRSPQGQDRSNGNHQQQGSADSHNEFQQRIESIPLGLTMESETSNAGKEPRPVGRRSERVGPNAPMGSRNARVRPTSPPPVRGGMSNGKLTPPGGKPPGLGGFKGLFTWKWLLIVGASIFLLSFGTLAIVMLNGEVLSFAQIEKANMPLAATVYDKNGNPATQFGSTQREYISIADLRRKNPMLVDAFIKVEDRRFWQHDGVDYQGLSRAILVDISQMRGAQGGGTITMQVCRNIVMKNSEKTAARKLQEFSCAWNLEKRYSKDQILEAYLNYINFGGDIAGVQKASEIYFGVDLKKKALSPEQVAVLAGMPKAPTTYNPINHPKQSIERRNVVLDLMAETNETSALITPEQAQKLKAKPIETDPNGMKTYAIKRAFDAYRDLVKRELTERYPNVATNLAEGGFRIYTGLDPRAQKAVEAALDKDYLFVNQKGQRLPNADAGITMLDPKTGLIRAVGGGRDYNPGAMNRALELNQPGSSIKPLTVFTPVVKDHQYNPGTMVPDQSITINGWTPNNFEGPPSGQMVPMDDVVKHSMNVPTVHLLHDQVGLDPAFQYAQALGLNLPTQDKAYAPLALGALAKGVNTEEMAGAYAVFPNQGYYIPPHTILEVTDAAGNVIQPQDQQTFNKITVFDPRSTYLVTSMLQDVIDSGTGGNARIPDGRPVAGKTGTNVGEQSGWFVGYTPDLVTAVNVFYPNRTGKIVQMTGGSAPAKIFSYVMYATLKGKPQPDFIKPPGVESYNGDMKTPHLDKNYDRNNQMVNLHWDGQSDQIAFQVYRSQDGGPPNLIASLQPGTNQYQDDISGLVSGGFLGGLFGGGGVSELDYYVVAVSTVDPSQTKQSNTVRVRPGNKKGH